MPNDVRVKLVPVQLDKDRNLGYDMNAFCDLEEKFGSMENAFKALEKGSIRNIRQMLWIGLLHEDETLTEREVGKMVSLNNSSELSAAMADAIKSSLPQVKESPNDKANESPNVQARPTRRKR